ncbi:MAG: proline racemase family protein, partial [Verrucomicrobiota bacterium]
MKNINVIDSHTEGEPTRAVIEGGPDLGSGSMAERRDRLRDAFDDYRKAVSCEPRGSDVIVGAWLCKPVSADSAAGVVFFNNVGYLGMCGHGTIGVAVTLAHLGRIEPGRHQLETPVGNVSFELAEDHAVTIENVPSYRHAADVSIEVDGLGTVTGDVAWGGNWFYLVKESPIPVEMSRIDDLTRAALDVR